MSFARCAIERCNMTDLLIPKHPSTEYRFVFASGTKRTFSFVREVCADVIARSEYR